MTIVADANLACELRAAENHDDRPSGAPIDMLVLHYTGMRSSAGALDWLCGSQSRVSSHYFVFEDGRIVQSVAEERRAWHAGKSSWRGYSDINSRSIGVEIANPGHEFGYVAFPDRQIIAVTALCRDIAVRRQIPPRNVVAHSDIAPSRKQDPGELFPWDKLHHAGIGHWVAPATAGKGKPIGLGDSGERVRALRVRLAEYGYGIAVSGAFDEPMQFVVTAFQRHFRPAPVNGVADPQTVATLENLIGALPSESALS